MILVPILQGLFCIWDSYMNYRCVISSLQSVVLGNKMSGKSSRTLYVGNLPGDIRLREVEDLFYKVLISNSFVDTVAFVLIFAYITHTDSQNHKI